MNFPLVGTLVRLRYKLLWARTRSRNGRIALFIVGYLLFILVVTLLAAGGVGAGMLAVRTGKAEMVAQAVLGGLFVQALLGTVIMGFGMNATFSDTELRRYPVTALERRLTRHLIGIVDPFWLLVLALELGLAVGLYAMGAASFWLGLFAVLLLFLCNYLFARVFGAFIDRLMERKGGSAVVLVVIIAFSFGAGQIPLYLKHHPGATASLLHVLAYTPPLGAAAGMVAGGARAAWGFGIILWWMVGLAAALVALERRPPQRQKLPTTALSFDSPFDRPAAWFGPDAPLIVHWLRFYVRNNRFRTMTLISLPLVGFLTWNFGRPKAGFGDLFTAALGTFAIVTFGTARFAVNQFGYVGGGFRRFFLLPVTPSTALRTGSYASLLLGVPLIPIALLGWIALAPRPIDPRQVFMLLCSSTAGLFVFHALGLWATIYGPRRSNYYSNLGNDLSLAGNLVIIGGVFSCILIPHGLKAIDPRLVSADYWWWALAAPLAAGLFYKISLRAAGRAFGERREQLMAVVEGRA